MFVACVDGWTDEQAPPCHPSNHLPVPLAPQACQAAIDQIEKRNETFKAAVQGPEGDAQEQEVNEDRVLGWSPQSHTGLLPLCSTQACLEGRERHPPGVI